MDGLYAMAFVAGTKEHRGRRGKFGLPYRKQVVHDFGTSGEHFIEDIN